MAAVTSLGQRKTDVFLSFRGDTRKNFTDHLYNALKFDGINVFRDEEGLQRGEHISTQLIQAIQHSRMSIVVFSKNYASSRWCLEELAEIMERQKSVIPVFYDVDPSDVRHQKGAFAEAFEKHEARYAEQKGIVIAWRAALTKAANLSGYHLNDGYEGELINKIVLEISTRLNVHGTQELPLLTIELEGKTFQTNKEAIWSWLMDDKVSNVGIFGMGGVGKTTLMKHIQNKLLKEWSSPHRYVYWVTISHDGFSISKLQNLIAEKVRLKLSNVEDESQIAAKLSNALGGNRKYIFILDDLWDYFDVLRVGIPISNRCKLVLTTRSQDICRKMQCNKENVIKVQPLTEKEAWNLFVKELGRYNTEVEQYAKDVARECSGLPLGIRVMASSMRGVSDICEWRNVVEELRESKVRQGDMDKEVLCVLKLSYLRLNDLTLQKYFLYCALFPEDHAIVRDDLIALLIAEGIIEEKKSREAEFDSGHTILNRLENICLLEGYIESNKVRCVKMHDLIRDMAIKELRESSTMTALIETKVHLQESPDIIMWNENLVIVSLMESHFEEIFFGHMSRCPGVLTLLSRENGCHMPRNRNLSTLLLRKNLLLERISISFFQRFCMLKVLDFSQCYSIKTLPESIGNLLNLTALFLCKCSRLMHVPSLAKLKKLKMLDLSGCERVRKLPKGLKRLSKLKYLDLTDTLIEEIPKGVLPKLSRLQVLKIMNKRIEFATRVEGREVGRLRKLETLECCFRHPSDFNQYMGSREQQSPCKYWFRIGLFRDYFVEELLRIGSNRVGISECSIGKGHDSVALPFDIQLLYIERCHALKCLCEDFSTLGASTQLHSICLRNCEGIESLISSSFVSHDSLKSLRHLKLWDLDNLCGLIRREDGTPPSPSNSSFSNLKIIDISSCHRLKKLFPPSLIPNLQNLEKIEVIYCDELEEIFTTDGREAESSAPTMFLPNLKSIYIRHCKSVKNELLPPSLLPNLHNLENITVDGCIQMEKIFAADKEEGGDISSSSNPSSFILPKLRELELKNLPELRSIYNGEAICHSLQEIALINCPKLKRMPFPLPQPSLQRITVYTKELWESVEWGNSTAKNHLQSLVVYTKIGW